MSRDRDVNDFDRRAASYDAGAVGAVHRRLAERGVAAALDVAGAPSRVLDVGCGPGTALRLLSERLPAATALVGVDPAPGMVAQARRSLTDPRVRIEHGYVEDLPVADRAMDLVITVTSFDHWADQERGLRRCAEALDDGGVLAVTDLFSPLLAPTRLRRPDRARTRRAVETLLRRVGFTDPRWTSAGFLISTVTARRPVRG